MMITENVKLLTVHLDLLLMKTFASAEMIITENVKLLTVHLDLL